MMEELINLQDQPIKGMLKLLISDKTTKQNIVFATDSYAHLGPRYAAFQFIDEEILLGLDACDLQPRVKKTLSEQNVRTKEKAEVFTASWICNKMNNIFDQKWFGRNNVFNTEKEDNTWIVNPNPITFPIGRGWEEYVDSKCLEITCGEAPFLVSRYDSASGELIFPPIMRIGMLDRKLRIISENTTTYDEWVKWTIRAYQSVYAFEWQGDNLLIARINLLLSFLDYSKERWNRNPTESEMKKIANIISWNTWQMDGLTGKIPHSSQEKSFRQISVFDLFEHRAIDQEKESFNARIYDWRSNKSYEFNSLKEMSQMKKKFTFCIGNPPYQEEAKGSSTSDDPIYHLFMDEAYIISDKVMLITPARFLFNAGKTPKSWNQKMLSDKHLSVVYYEHDSSKVFPNKLIPGGVAITYRDAEINFGEIGTFVNYPELNNIKCCSPNYLMVQSSI